MGAHGLSAAFTVDAGSKAFAVSAFMLFEAQRCLQRRGVVCRVLCKAVASPALPLSEEVDSSDDSCEQYEVRLKWATRILDPQQCKPKGNG